MTSPRSTCRASRTRAWSSSSEILKGVEGIDFVRFGEEDVVRHKLVRRIVAAYNEHAQQLAPELHARKRA